MKVITKRPRSYIVEVDEKITLILKSNNFLYKQLLRFCKYIDLTKHLYKNITEKNIEYTAIDLERIYHKEAKYLVGRDFYVEISWNSSYSNDMD